MVNCQNVLIVLLSTIFFNFSCSSNQNDLNVKTQDLKVKNVEFAPTADQNLDKPIANPIKPVEPNKNWKREEIAEPIEQADGEFTVENITQERDMSQYKQGGHTDCRRFKCNQRKTLDFIWKHWTKKKRGYVRITHSADHVAWTDHIFIEPNEKGEWNIAWRLVRKQDPMQSTYWLDDIVGIVSVVHIRRNSKHGKYDELLFKNKDGETIRTFSF
ncbi:MAG TPA: hypothetical protein VK308_11365 [Pyrinomonadaceae bacterium]|nr:hypothetical protein [Pyrinomonadaceae bacterium]